jgi:Fe-S cluster assembly ATPase SufC
MNKIEPKKWNDLNEDEKEVYLEKGDRIVEIIKDINLNEITILTGSNGSGKSLIRGQMTFKSVKEYGQPSKHISMELRTSSNASWGAMSGAMRDNEIIPTSLNTFRFIEGLYKTIDNEKLSYLVIDEPEIGMSEETQLSLIHYFNEVFLPKLKELNRGCLIITHSRLLIEHINSDRFVNIEGLTKNQYLNRVLIPTNLEELKNNYLFKAIQEMQKEK